MAQDVSILNPPKRGAGKVSALTTVSNPLVSELLDTDIKKLAENASTAYPYIPFLDNSDANLALFQKLGELSTTQCATINKICSYAFDGGFEVRKQGISGLKTVFDNTISQADEQRMIDFVALFSTFDNLLYTVKRLGVNLKTYGNAVLELVMVDVAGEKRASLISHDATTFRYLATVDPSIKIGLLSPSFKSQYLYENEPRVIPMYPDFDEQERGVRRTLIHIKNEFVGRNYYGLPNSIGSLMYQFLEYQQGKYTVEGYANDWTAKLFIEASVMDKSDGEGELDEEGFGEAIQQSFSNAGQGKKILFRAKPEGLTETRIHEFQNNTNEAFHKTMGEIAEDKIIASHDWHPVLNSKTAGSLGGSTEFDTIYRQKYTSVIMPFQNVLANTMALCFANLSEFYNYDLQGLSLGFANMLQDYLDSNQQQNVPNASDIVGTN